MTKNRFGDFFHPIFAVDLVYDFMISVNNVSVVFGGFYLLDSVSFLINKKDRIGLTGRNGAGKSTTLKMLAGLQIPSEGNISMASDIKIGYLPQTKVYTDGNTVRKEAEKAFADLFALKDEVERLNLELAGREDYESEAYMKLLDKIHEKTELLAIRGENNIDREVEVVLKGLGFKPEDLDRNCEEFSGGWRMRIELAKLLLRKPDVLLLDEPLTSFDVVVADEMKALLRRIKTRHIILLSTHIMDLALDLCDDIVILHHGVLQEVRREDLADEAYKDRIIAALKEEPDVV